MHRQNSTSSSSQKSAPAPFSLDKLPDDKRRERIHKEYSKLCVLDADPRADFSTSTSMSHLNRYCNILANQLTLFPPSSDPGMYINANRMPFDTPHTLIAAQAPVDDEGLEPWWNVIYSYKIALVMMLTREVENHVPKADRYWPESVKDVEPFGRFRVRLEEEQNMPDLQLKIRHLVVWIDEGSGNGKKGSKGSNAPPPPDGCHNVVQVQYLGWPDHGIPSSTVAFQQMIARMESHPTDAPILVHCSAGIGRTGTLIGYYVVKQRLAAGLLNERTVYETVGTMKRARRGMVQRQDQYNFIYQCLLEELAAQSQRQTEKKS